MEYRVGCKWNEISNEIEMRITGKICHRFEVQLGLGETDILRYLRHWEKEYYINTDLFTTRYKKSLDLVNFYLVAKRMTPESLAWVKLLDANLWNTGIQNESLVGVESSDWISGESRHRRVDAAEEVENSFESYPSVS